MSLIDKEIELNHKKSEKKSRKHYIFIGIAGLAIILMLFSMIVSSRSKKERDTMAETLKTYETANDTLKANNNTLKISVDELMDNLDALEAQGVEHIEIIADQSLELSTLIAEQDERSKKSPVDYYLASKGLSDKVIGKALQIHLLINGVPDKLNVDRYQPEMLIEQLLIDESNYYCLFEVINNDRDTTYVSAIYSYELVGSEIVFELKEQQILDYHLSSAQDVFNNTNPYILSYMVLNKEDLSIIEAVQYLKYANTFDPLMDKPRTLGYDDEGYYLYDRERKERIPLIDQENIQFNGMHIWNTDYSRMLISTDRILDVYTLEYIRLEDVPEYVYGWRSLGEYIGMINMDEEYNKYNLVLYNWNGQKILDIQVSGSDEVAEGSYIEIIGFEEDKVVLNVTEFGESGSIVRTVDVLEGTVTNIGKANGLQLTESTNGYYLVVDEYIDLITGEERGSAILNMQGEYMMSHNVYLAEHRILGFNDETNELYSTSFMINPLESGVISNNVSYTVSSEDDSEEVVIVIEDTALPYGEYTIHKIIDEQIYIYGYFVDDIMTDRR